MIAQAIERRAIESPEKTAVQIKRDGKYYTVTYAELWSRSIAVAAALRDAGTQSSDRVALYADNTPEWVVCFLGIHLLGAVVVPLDVQYRAGDIEPLLLFSESKAVIADRDRVGEVEEFIESSGAEINVFVIDPADPVSIINAPEQEGFVAHSHNPDDLMSIIFTSGTTGDPKGVELTVGNIYSNVTEVLSTIKVRGSDNILNILPLHHVYSSNVGLIGPLCVGATVTFCSSLKGPELLSAMQETGVSIFPGVPKLFSLFDRAIFQKVDSLGLVQRMVFLALFRISGWLRRAAGLRAGRFFFSAIHKQFGPKFRFMASGGAKLDKNVCERFLDLGFVLIEGYGLTETSPVISFTSLSDPTPGSVGLPIEGVEVKIDSLDSEGTGEICVRGPGLMRGYHNNDEATGKVMKDGFFHTGDLGYMDSKGMIHITGRANEVITLSSGKNIYPEDVEKHYAETQMVEEICILPVEGGEAGVERLRAVVVPDAGELAARHVVDVRERIRSQLAIVGAKLPSYMHVTDLVLLDAELPRTRLGKLRRAKIEEMVKEKKESGTIDGAREIPREMVELMDAPQSKKFLKRLAELTRNDGPFYPDQELAIDLGVDSLTKLQLAVVLEQEFSTKVNEEELSELNTVGDMLEIIRGADTGEQTAEAELSWSAVLREPPLTRLDELFNVRRGALNRLMVRVIKALGYVLVRIFFRATIKGAEKIPRDRPVLICPSHNSYIDPVLLYCLLPGEVVNGLFFVGFGDAFRRPPLSWIVKSARIIFTGAASTMVESLKLSYDALNRGNIVCIFPEGGRATGKDFMKPRPGAGILSVEAGVPVVPVYIKGADNILSPVRPGFRLTKISLYVGEPIEPPPGAASPMESYGEMMSSWERAVRGLRDEAGELGSG
ncbi:MAG: AMP-binding protein [Thermodesulfobacteriota bacterium]